MPIPSSAGASPASSDSPGYETSHQSTSRGSPYQPKARASHESHGLSTEVVVFLGIVIPLVLVGLAVAGWHWYHRRKRAQSAIFYAPLYEAPKEPVYMRPLPTPPLPPPSLTMGPCGSHRPAQPSGPVYELPVYEAPVELPDNAPHNSPARTRPRGWDYDPYDLGQNPRWF